MTAQAAGDADPSPLMTKPWAEIEEFYRWLVDGGLNVRGMLSLVEQIEASQYARALHAWTSMHALWIVQVPCAFPCDLGYLRVTPLFDGMIEFRYIDTHIAEKQWHRRVKEDDAFVRLERFIDQLHWVVREKAATP
jgi:hypothetical protein